MYGRRGNGAPGRTLTCDLPLRRGLLYTTELLRHGRDSNAKRVFFLGFTQAALAFVAAFITFLIV